MAIDLSCPHCFQVMRINDPQAVIGKTARCPGCQQTFVVQIPGLGDETAAPPLTAPVSSPEVTGGSPYQQAGGANPLQQPGFSPATTSSEDSNAAPPGRIWKVVIEKIRGTFNAGQLRFMGRRMADVGTYGLMGGIVLYALYWIVFGFKGDLSFGFEDGERVPERSINWYNVLFGLGSVVGLTAIQFVNQKLLGAIEGQIDSARTRVSTTAVFDALGILFLVLAVLSPLSMIYAAIDYEEYFMIFVGLAVFVVFGYLALVSLNPEFLNIHPDSEATAADDAMALYAFGVKVYISVIPLLYGILVVLGCVGLFIGILDVLFEIEADWVSVVHVSGASAFTAALGLPFFGYLLGIVALLSLFVLQAILSIPVKLDELKKP